MLYPNINPIALHFGPIKIYWYGIMYVTGFAFAYLLAKYRITKKVFLSDWNLKQLDDLILYCILGVLIGGRLGYVFFYDLPAVLDNPLFIFQTWQGGMAFHGGLIGVLFACYFFGRKNNRNFLLVTDFLAPLAPIGLACGRIGNFINSELWGRVTNVSWGIVFPNGGSLPRHPSQIYEFFLEGIVLFLIIWFYSAKPRTRGATSALFLLCYGIFRFFIEFFREPDPQYGYIAFNWLTMGQILSLPMIICGIWLFVWVTKTKSAE